MQRFVLGFLLGIIFSLCICSGLPFKWEDDPEKKIVTKANDKLIIIIGSDETMDFISECRVSKLHGVERIIHIFQSKEDADACKKRVSEQAVKNKG